jgi:hypothetical protein
MTGLLGKSEANLTGTWHGQYTYPSYLPPVFFVATLLEATGRIEGSTREPRPVIGETLCAAIAGHRSGNAVTFVKTYQRAPRGYDVINYAGTLSADGTEIEGRWRIPGDGSGKFLMIRFDGIAEAISREISELV